MNGRQMDYEALALTMTSSPVEREEPDSAQALQRALAGDRAAFDELILRYQGRVMMTAWRLLGSKEEAQDATQEVFLRLYRHLRRVNPKRPLSPWLYRMTVNICHDLSRKRRREPEVDVGQVDPLSPADDPEQASARTEQRRLIREALKALPEKERTAVVLRDIEGLSTAEVAGILGSSESTVRSQMSSARVKIKRFVERVERRRS